MDISIRSNYFRKVKPKVFLFLAFLLASTLAFGQTEICNNGLDDDFDGFIDCYDGSCSNSPLCDGIFLGNDANCSVPPPQFPKFTMTLDFSSPTETTNHLARMAIGDLDRDGMPEIVTMNRYTKKLFILNGNNGSVKSQTTVTWEPQWEIAIGNLDNDNCAEIFFIGQDNSPALAADRGIFLFAYDCNLNFLWRTAKKLPGDPINFGLADFDADGKVEIYAKDEIYDAKTGIRIVKSTAPSYSQINGGPVAIDMDGALALPNNSNLELVIGLNIYQVNLGARTVDAGSLILLQGRNDYFIRDVYNATSIADYNLDGSLDVIASGSTIGNNKNTTVFFWDVKNNVLKTYRDLASSYGANGWQNGTGRINISDLDGDGKQNVSFVSGKYLYALKEDFTLHWRIIINEETSGYTGCTLFDFNGDGQAEIVYRDERFLYIIQGTDGSIYSQVNCSSRTNREYPIVADVDADGSTEICVTCAVTDIATADFNNFVTNGSSLTLPGHIRVFKSAAEPWVPARRVWNQHGYFVVNINDDLTIPKVLQKHQLVFSTGNCTQGPNRPLNKFLNQSPFLNSEGCPTYASPDLAFSIAPTVVPPTCPDLNFTVSFQLTNLGDVGLSGNIPISFYTKNPNIAGSTKLNTITIPLVNFKPNDVFDVVNATVTGNGSDSLYVVLNDAGTTVPTPIKLPNTTFFECNYDNILGVKVKPKPVKLTALEVNPNEKCSSPNNGAARAFIPITGGGENTADYNFYWSNGAVAKPFASADFAGPIYSGIAEGTYTVYAIHKTANCSSDTVQVVITAIPSIVPTVTVNVLSHQTLCNPPNGKLEALVTGGNSGYTFEWFNNATTLGITTSVASGLIGGNYTVVVSRNGCTVSNSAIVDDNAPDPDVTATSTPIVNCQNPSSGAVSATVSIGGVSQPLGDYTFAWYFYDNGTSTRGSQLPAANGTGPNRTGLVAGFYQVVATNSTSLCPSSPFIVEVKNQTLIPVVTIVELAPQTSCDPANPNGRLQATVTIAGVPQNASDFVFQWFVGQNTLPANLHATVSGTNGSIADKVKGGGQSYTVKATSASQCFSTDDGVVSETLKTPVVTLSTNPNGICDPALVIGSVTFQGSVTASVTFAGNPVIDFTNYSFEWYNGSQAIGAKRPESTSVLSALDGGFYTLLVKRTDISCTSTAKTAEVINTTTLPAITASAIGSTNCIAALANGQARVTDVDGAGTALPYLFKWHTGVDTAVPIVGATNAILGNLQGAVGAFFTVLVTNQTNGCQNTETLEVTDKRAIPILTLTATDNENCTAPFNGTAAANTITYKGLPEALAGYSFTWTHGPTTSTASGLNVGTYEATATRVDVGCTSNPVKVDVKNKLYLPVINVAITNQTSCLVTSPNGILSASMNETSIGGPAVVTAGYIYNWTNDGNPLTPGGPSVGGNNSVISSLSGNRFYTLTVERSATRCTNTQSVFLPERINLPRLELVATDIVDCNTHGFVTARIFIDKNNDGDSNDAGDELTPAEIASDYSIAWFSGSNTLGAPLAETDRVLDGNGVPLPQGNYTAIATNNVSNCKTSDFTDVINGPGPLFNLAITINNKPASCADSDGVMTAFVDTGGGVPAPFGNFTFQWFQGNPTNGLAVPTPNFYTNPVVQFIQPALAVDPTSDFGTPYPGLPTPQAPTSVNTGPSLFGRTSGTYSVVVTNNTSGCKEFKTIFLPYQTEPVIILARIKPDECGPPVGEIEVELSAPSPPNQYFLQIYPTANPKLGVDTPLTEFTAAALGNVFNSLSSGIYSVVARENPAIIISGCYSSPLLVQLIEALPPKVDIIGSGANTTCVASPVLGDGSLQIKVSTDTNDPFSASYPLPPPPTFLQRGAPPFVNYSIDVKDAGNVAVPGYPTASTFVDGNTELINGLRGETYTITVTSSKGCSTTKTFNIPNAPRVADLSGNVTVLPALACDPLLETNASIEVNKLAIPGIIANDNLSDYRFDWFTKVDLSTMILTANGDNTAVKGGEILSNVGPPLPTPPGTKVTAGSYWVRATKVNAGATGGLGCLTAPFKVDIDDKSVKPTAVLTSTSDTSCETLALFEGSISVQVTNAGSIPTPTYEYIWTSTGVSTIANNPASNGSLLTVPNLSDGRYSLSFKNNTSGCIGVIQTTIVKSATPIVVSNANAINQFICNPDGSITVGANDILVNGSVDSDHTHFDFSWSRNTVANLVGVATQSNDVFNNIDLPTIGADSYFVKVKKRSGLNPGSGCESPPFKVDILDKSRVPDISFTSIVPNSSCTPTSPNGFLEATASERVGPAGVYNFIWTFNGGPVPPVTILGGASPISDLTNAGPGTYLVEATNTNTGCKFNQVRLLETNQTLSLPNIIDIDEINPTTCLPQGSLQVVSVTIGGTTVFTNPPDDLDTDYDYEWFKNTIPAGLIAGQPNSLLSNQLPGKYFVRVKNVITDCVSAAVETEISTAKIVYPVVSVQQTSPQVLCTINLGSGALVSLADGKNDTDPNYTFTWFPNLNLSGPSFASTSSINSLVAGDYSLEVHNLATDCKASAIFILPENKVEFKPVLALSSNPLTECDINDGSVFARGVPFPVNTDLAKNYPFAYDYTADLYIGNPPADINNPEFPDMPNDPNNPGLIENHVQVNLVNGLYTVRLTDNNTGCETIDKVSVDDLRKFPKPVITTVAPVTNCDPAKPNGVARVTVDGTFIGFEFTWFEGNAVAGIPFYTGSEFGSLKVAPQTYTVEAINLVTGCKGNVQTSITNGTLPIPSPQIDILSQVTSCLFNNGALAASVGGITKDYVFNWYDGAVEAPPADFIGEVYDSLAKGTYSVTATSRITGCKSPLANKAIEDKKEFPEFDFKIQNASCDQPNGFATVFFSSMVGISTIEWFSSNQLVAFGPNLTDAAAGIYSVKIVSELGCETDKDMEILADIRPRNGISRNGDSQNDYFHIDCIDQFENNNVKVFNRAGTLVYEADGYDNANIYFNGGSNRGISLIGTDVPDGTYYFIVDKRNGSKPIAGYLEIVK